MAAGDYRLGINGEFFQGASGSTPTTEIDNVFDVTLNMSARVAEAIRRKKAWVAKKPVIKEASLEFSCYDIVDDAFVTAVKDAFLNGTKIALYPCDGDPNAVAPDDGEGLDADWYITGFTRVEGNEDFMQYNVTAEITDESRDPVWG